MLKSSYKQVIEFHKKFGHAAPDYISNPDIETRIAILETPI